VGLEKMHLEQALVVPNGFLKGVKGAQMTPLAGFGLAFGRIQTVFTGFKLSYHTLLNHGLLDRGHLFGF
jgi:hypothetical protein